MLAVSRQLPGRVEKARMKVPLVSQDAGNGGHIVFSSLAKLLTLRFDRGKNNFDEEPEHGVVLPTKFKLPWYNPQSKKFEDQEWDVDTLETDAWIEDEDMIPNQYVRQTSEIPF